MNDELRRTAVLVLEMYAELAADPDQEAEALEWIEALIVDVADDA
jgi:hypothetical protein